MTARLDPARLETAVGLGILTRPQADRLAEFWAEPLPVTAGSDVSAEAPADVPDGVDHVDAEEVRFARGFHDIFISIGIVVFLFGLVFGLRDQGPPYLVTGVAAAAVWALSEIFARRLRLALPSFLLTVAFAPLLLIACTGFVTGGDPLFDHRVVDNDLPLYMIVPTLLGIAGGALHYWRFRVPVGIAIVAGTVLFLAALTIETAAPGVLLTGGAWFTLAAGLATFVVAMRYDARDPRRVTVASDKAFWLHLLAAPLVVHSVLLLATDGVEVTGSTDAVVAIALFMMLAFVAVVVDRRALLVSGLGYFGIAIGRLMTEAQVSGETSLAITLILLGCFILLLGSAWRVVRRVLCSPLRGTAVSRIIPAFE
ncbi:hypothetical protein [Stappia indica]|uniref:hypothetical protein n=1 Tax=Stappia indica TaxID=538381 RepID=UPI001D18B71C|nr:hypothetical protein [Stappia indica]MCC4246626.1 hypothetical protein [Stappia indica]